jgi:DNA-binding transcriptional regulator YiaG
MTKDVKQPTEFAVALKAWRDAQGLTQEKAAQALSAIIGQPVRYGLFCSWEQGVHAPRGYARALILDRIQQTTKAQ